MYVNIDDTGRVTLSTTRPEWANPGYYEVEEPADLDGHSIFDYVYSDGALVYDPLPEPDPQPSVDERLDAVEAKAEQALEGANPQLTAFARMQLVNAAPTMTDADILKVPSLVPEWEVGTTYEAKQVIKYEGELYRIAQKHTAQEQWKPGSGTESLYTRITQSGGYDVWQQPTGAHDAYSKGTRVWYPTADSNLYESLIDGNTWSPEAYPAGWKKVEE